MNVALRAFEKPSAREKANGSKNNSDPASLTVAVITAGNRAISRGCRFRSCRHSGLGLHSRIREHSWLPDPCWNSYACPASGQSSTPADVLGFARCNFGLPASLLITLLSCGGICGSAVTRSPAVTPVLRWFGPLILFAFCSLRGILTEIAVMNRHLRPASPWVYPTRVFIKPKFFRSQHGRRTFQSN
jgi:hypothetical protein